MHNRHDKWSQDCNRNGVKVTEKNKLKIETAPAKRRQDNETRARLDVVGAKVETAPAHNAKEIKRTKKHETCHKSCHDVSRLNLDEIARSPHACTV